MSDDSQVQIARHKDESSLVLSSARSSLVARGRRDAAVLAVQDQSFALWAETRGLAENGDADAQNARGNLLCRLAEEFSDGRRGELFDHSEDSLKEQEDLYYAEAVMWYRKAIDQGDVNAQVSLGNLYNQGCGVTEDLKEALKLWGAAAEQGHPEGQHMLGLHYSVGKGLPLDYAEAAKWLRKSAEQGNAWAQYDLAVVCAIRGDFAEAAEWLRESVEQEFDEAKRFLVRLYEEGKMVPVDDVEAQRWNEMVDAEAQRQNEIANVRQIIERVGIETSLRQALQALRNGLST